VFSFFVVTNDFIFTSAIFCFGLLKTASSKLTVKILVEFHVAEASLTTEQ